MFLYPPLTIKHIKPQGTTRQLLHDRIRDAYVHPQFVADVMRPLKIDDIIDQEVDKLIGIHKICWNYASRHICVYFVSRSKTFLVASFNVLPSPSV